MSTNHTHRRHHPYFHGSHQPLLRPYDHSYSRQHHGVHRGTTLAAGYGNSSPLNYQPVASTTAVLHSGEINITHLSERSSVEAVLWSNNVVDNHDQYWEEDGSELIDIEVLGTVAVAPSHLTHNSVDLLDVNKYVKTRIHHASAPKDEVDDEESEICVICHAEYEHEETIGKLFCGHEYHMDCIKQWLPRKNECPLCRALVLPCQNSL